MLLLAKKPPYPAHDGEAIAILQLAKGLVANGAVVTILYMNTRKHHFEAAEIPEDLQKQIRFIGVDVNNDVQPLAALFNIFSPLPYHVVRFKSNTYLNALKQLLHQQQFDVIQAEGLYLIQYFQFITIPKNTKLIYRSHNIEAAIWSDITNNTRSIFKKWYLGLQAKKLYRYEKKQPALIDAVLPISTADTLFYREHFNNLPIHHTPTGVELTASVIPKEINTRTLYFIGGLDWIPNVEGLFWFMDEVFPALLNRFPDLTFHIAGRNGDAGWKSMQRPGIIYHGAVPEAADFASDKYICIVPLLSGSGMKIKIIEAMFLGKPVVTTSKGASGMPDGTSDYFYTASSVQTFIQQVTTLLEQPEIGKQKGLQAKTFVEQQLSHSAITQQLIEFYQNLPLR